MASAGEAIGLVLSRSCTTICKPPGVPYTHSGVAKFLDYPHRGGSSMHLVFASGFLVPQRLLGIDYFRGLKDHIAAAGVHEALFPAVPPAGTSKVRAQALADAIQQKYPVGEIHIIAHSMGGLDRRTLIARHLHGLSHPGRIKTLPPEAT